MPPAAEWRVEDDVIILGALHVTVERIAASHWRADERLRSWGQAPMQRENDAVLAPCAADECLWLGAWLEEDTLEDPTTDPGAAQASSLTPPPARSPATAFALTPARITLSDPAGGGYAVATLPEAYQLGALRSTHAAPAPLQLAPSHSSRRLRLGFECGPTQTAFDLVLLPYAAWTARTHRPPPAPLDAPPPLPPRLG